MVGYRLIDLGSVHEIEGLSHSDRSFHPVHSASLLMGQLRMRAFCDMEQTGLDHLMRLVVLSRSAQKNQVLRHQTETLNSWAA